MTLLTLGSGAWLSCSVLADDIDAEVEEATEVVYQATSTLDGGDSAPEWPKGFAETKLRFIRLDHGGAGWDDGMGKSGADVNFLRAFGKKTGSKVAGKGESHSIAHLKKYPADGFPPFVFMTGNGNVGRVSSADAKTLREYCLKGGMIIADAGSARFHRSFMHLMRQVFPDKSLVDIADDDKIYQLPYQFSKGAPAFWSHGGQRAQGIKHDGRWCVFYHPGDMNDAWKSEGYSDVTPEMREAAMNLGVNLVFYSMIHWDEAVQKEDK